ncbi:MAG: bifunctional 5,10-methylenetetrahydrofolate dehydrogenase/5,10-methenyltetrahydrofolate cyclohydrolase [Candidatus Bathyarchaeia archaeon]
MATILDGRAAASAVMEELKAWAEELRGKGVEPTLALVLVGDDKRSRRYVRMKVRRAELAGVEAQLHRVEEGTQEELLRLIDELNGDAGVHGIMVQLPLPEGFDELATVEAISPEKDVDGLSPATRGKLLMGEECFPPAGVEAIVELLRRHGIDPEHGHWVIAGLSNIVGKPLAALLANMEASVTCLHADHPELAKFTREADVLVVDVARKWAVTAEMVKPGAVVVDNGNNYEGRKVYGDVDFDGVKEVASAITPVPGGVGPLLIAMLIRNTLKAAARSIL